MINLAGCSADSLVTMVMFRFYVQLVKLSFYSVLFCEPGPVMVVLRLMVAVLIHGSVILLVFVA